MCSQSNYMKKMDKARKLGPCCFSILCLNAIIPKLSTLDFIYVISYVS